HPCDDSSHVVLAAEGFYLLDMSLSPKLRRGHVIWLPPGRSLRHRVEDSLEQRSIQCRFNPDELQQRLDALASRNERWQQADSDIQERSIRHLLERLRQEIHTPGLNSAFLVECICHQVIL